MNTTPTPLSRTISVLWYSLLFLAAVGATSIAGIIYYWIL